MKEKLTEGQLNALAEAVRKELKENDSDVLYFDECDYFWPRDQKGNDIEATDFADDLGIKLGLSFKFLTIFATSPAINSQLVNPFNLAFSFAATTASSIISIP